MPSPEPSGPGQKRCPVCWTPFTPNDSANPHPRRYCSGACRIEDSPTSSPRQPVHTSTRYGYR